MIDLPVWWHWPLEMSPHALRRMPMRGFNEVDLRMMLAEPIRCIPDACPGRWLVECRLYGKVWHVIMEPDTEHQVTIVVTAFAPSYDA